MSERIGEPRIVLCRTAAEAVRRTADRLEGAVKAAVAERGQAAIALSGGSTPRPLYDLLASPAWRERIPWKKLLVFFADERAVPHSSAESNGGTILRQLLAPVGVPMHQVNFLPTASFDIAGAAADYEATLRKKLGDPPRLDFVLLGLGSDGHTASLFPGSPVLAPTARLVLPSIAQTAATKQRLTLSVAALSLAREVVFLVTGADKRDAVHGTLAGPDLPSRWPAQLIAPGDGALIWFLDADAAGVSPDDIDPAIDVGGETPPSA